MKLNNAVLSQSLPGYALPQYDRQAMARRSRQQPTWLHFGAGNLFRAFPAVLAQRLLNAGETDTGVLCCEAYDTDAVTQFLRPYDDLTLSVSLLADGSMEKEVVGSIAPKLDLAPGPLPGGGNLPGPPACRWCPSPSRRRATP